MTTINRQSTITRYGLNTETRTSQLVFLPIPSGVAVLAVAGAG